MDIDNDREKTALSLVVGIKMGTMAQKRPSIRKLPGGGASTALSNSAATAAATTLTTSGESSTMGALAANNNNNNNNSNSLNGPGVPKQARVSAGARVRPPVSIEAPVGAFPVSGLNTGTDKKDVAMAGAESVVVPLSPVLPHKQPNGSGFPRQHTGRKNKNNRRNNNNHHHHDYDDLSNIDLNSNGHPGPPPSPPPLRFSFASPQSVAAVVAAEWTPTLSLDFLAPGSSPTTLKTREIFETEKFTQIFHLEKQYMIRASLPRSFFIVMMQHEKRPHCVFEFPQGEKWWKDLAGMRKSTYIEFKAENSPEQWELHLKPSKDRTNLLGYIFRHDELANMISSQKFNMLKARKLPLVLDLDDTLVRLVGNERTRYVSDADAEKVPDRVRTLKDGRRVVLTEYVEEFLEWACKFYDISVCSLGEQSYVDMVADVLDPEKTRIRGTRYSARQEYDFLNASPPTSVKASTLQAGPISGTTIPITNVNGAGPGANTNITGSGNGNGKGKIPASQPLSPPKDLLSLYAFCAMTKPSMDGLPEIGSGFSLPLILDDLTQMWPPDQHDNVIVVKERKNSPVWTVNLFPMVQHVLGAVHQEFFRAYDSWERARLAALASITITVGGLGIGGGPAIVGGVDSGVNGDNNNTTTAIDATAVTAAKTQFLSMQVPSAIGCYKEWLRGSLRDQISLTAAAPPAHLREAVAQQRLLSQQQPQPHGQHPIQSMYQPMQAPQQQPLQQQPQQQPQPMQSMYQPMQAPQQAQP